MSRRALPVGPITPLAPWDGSAADSPRTARYDPSRLSNLLRAWGNANRKTRIRILRGFVAENQHRTAAEMEHVYGNSVSLFLSRLSSWFRMSSDSGLHDGLGVQMQALDVFLKAPAGTGFVADFAESGSLMTLLEVIAADTRDFSSGHVEHSIHLALQLLLHVVKCGRKYKEQVCQSGGVVAVVQCMASNVVLGVNELARDVMLALGSGNPRHIKVVLEGLAAALTRHDNVICQQTACQILHTLLAETTRHTHVMDGLSQDNHPLGMGLDLYPVVLQLEAEYAKAGRAAPVSRLQVFMVEAALDMLTSSHLQATHAASEVLRLLLQVECTRRHVIEGLVDILHDPEVAITIEAQDAGSSSQATKGEEGGEGQGLSRSASTEHSESILFGNKFSSQYNAARTLELALDVDEDVLGLMVEANAALALLGAATNNRDHDTQCAAFSALAMLTTRSDEATDRVQELLQPSVWVVFLDIRHEATVAQRQSFIQLISDPVMASDIRWRLAAAGWDCHHPRKRVGGLSKQILWLRPPMSDVPRPAAGRGRGSSGSSGSGEEAGRERKEAAMKVATPRRPTSTHRSSQPHRRSHKRTLRLVKAHSGTPAAGASRPGVITANDRDYKTKMLMLMRRAAPHMATETLKFKKAQAPTTAAFSASVYNSRSRTQNAAARLREGLLGEEQPSYSESAELSFRQYSKAKDTDLNGGEESTGTGADVMQFLRDQYGGDSTAPSSGAQSELGSYRGMAALQQGVQARTLTKLPNMYPFNSGETQAGLQVMKTMRSGSSRKLQTLAMRSKLKSSLPTRPSMLKMRARAKAATKPALPTMPDTSIEDHSHRVALSIAVRRAGRSNESSPRAR